MRSRLPPVLVVGTLSMLVWFHPAAAQLTIGGDPRVNPADFRITTFASGLNFPNGMAILPDGSLLVATSRPSQTSKSPAILFVTGAAPTHQERISRPPYERWPCGPVLPGPPGMPRER
jgi:sugar lactone lactonase YvrE